MLITIISGGYSDQILKIFTFLNILIILKDVFINGKIKIKVFGERISTSGHNISVSPSGFNMGTNLKTYFDLKAAALASDELRRNLMKPLIT